MFLAAARWRPQRTFPSRALLKNRALPATELRDRTVPSARLSFPIHSEHRLEYLAGVGGQGEFNRSPGANPNALTAALMTFNNLGGFGQLNYFVPHVDCSDTANSLSLICLPPLF